MRLKQGTESVLFDRDALVELTKRCNYFCDHCYTNASPHARGPEPMPADVGSLLRSLSRLGFRSAILSGGEPMLRRDIDEIVQEVPEGLDVWMFTSGIRIDEARLARWQGRITGFAVSLDGTRERHNELRRSARSFDDIVSFLRLLAREGCRIHLQSMVTRKARTHLSTIVELAEAIHAERVLFSHVSPDGRGAALHDDHMSVNDLDDLQAQVDQLQTNCNVVLHTNLMPRHLIEARFPKPVIHALPQGGVVPWFGAPATAAIGNLADSNWDLEASLLAARQSGGTLQTFERARRAALLYPGRAVPVDDLLVAAFRDAGR